MLKVLVLSCGLIASVPPAIAQEAQTLKERLSDKASDAQRVDNCRVPVERRGPIPRPDCVTKLRGNNCHRNALHSERGAVRVSQIVKPDRGLDFGGFAGGN